MTKHKDYVITGPNTNGGRRWIPKTLHRTTCRWAKAPTYSSVDNDYHRNDADAADVTFSQDPALDHRWATWTDSKGKQFEIRRCYKCRPLSPDVFIERREFARRQAAAEAKAARQEELLAGLDEAARTKAMTAIKMHFTQKVGKDGACRIVSDDEQILADIVAPLLWRGEQISQQLAAEAVAAAAEQPQSNGEVA